MSGTTLMMVAVAPETPLRKDAQRNRAAIVSAARELFAESADVPMYEVARQAGVGQATLYRNFPDRRDLAAAVLDDYVVHTEELAAEHAGDPDAFFVLLRSVVERTSRFHTLAEIAREEMCLGSQLGQCRARLTALMKEPLRDAKAAGTVRRDLTMADVFLVLSMVKGAVGGAEDAPGRVEAAGRALTLLFDGVSRSPLGA